MQLFCAFYPNSKWNGIGKYKDGGMWMVGIEGARVGEEMDLKSKKRNTTGKWGGAKDGERGWKTDTFNMIYKQLW